MENKKIALFVFLALMLPSGAKGIPVITDANITPENPWFGQDIRLSLSCNDSTDITRVYAEIFGPEIILKNDLDFSPSGGGLYELFVPAKRLTEPGNYYVNLFCENNLSESSNTTLNFMVSVLNGYVTEIDPQPSYTGDVINIYFMVKKDNTPLTSDVDFNVYLDGKTYPFTVFNYHVVKGWNININAPEEGEHELKLVASYDGESLSNLTQIVTKRAIDFDILKMDKTSLSGGEPLTLTLRVLEKDSPVILKEEYLDFEVNGISAPIDYISTRGNGEYDVRIITPELSPGSYTLRVTMKYKDQIHIREKEIIYVIPVSGVFSQEGKGLPITLSFKSKETEQIWRFKTNGLGEYQGSIKPGMYDIELLDTRTKSKITFYDVLVEEFNDPVKYYAFGPVDIEGIDVAAVYVFENDMNFQGAQIELKYDDSKINDENEIEVFACENWNTGKKQCNSGWGDEEYALDTMRNYVRINTDYPKTYAIGTRKKLIVKFTLDREVYYSGYEIIIDGTVYDNTGRTVPDVKLNVFIEGSEVSEQITTNSNGVFSLTLTAPSEEGRYHLVIEAVKNPYAKGTTKKDIEVRKKRELNIIPIDSIQLQRNDSYTVNISIRNSGQTEMKDIELSVSGLPEEFYGLKTSFIDSLMPGQTVTIPLIITIPSDAKKTSYIVTIKVKSGSSEYENSFALSVVEGIGITPEEESPKTKTQVTHSPDLFTGFAFVDLSPLWESLTYIAVFVSLSLPLVLLMKKRKKRQKVHRKWVRHVLKGLEHEINRFNTKNSKDKKG